MRTSVGNCRNCGALIFWARTSNDKPIPLDLASVPKKDHGKLSLRYSQVEGHVAHFVTCPKAEQSKKRGA